ncbi:hypothetical protein [Bacillus sp. V33-4]|uniref:hypothetical protein n=1 Tax=Bacillus sp. V33-4 TaxID=2054169 RepID=UPI000C77BC57|nr:hypothetical protein [Bacillus sp. V33-4]PLR87770.1 hypothetical protein CVD23_00900 [Bacillus sp. V33-4]
MILSLTDYICIFIHQTDLTLMNNIKKLHLYLTDEGKELGDTIIPVTEEFNRLVTSGITADEIYEVKRILSKMKLNVLYR